MLSRLSSFLISLSDGRHHPKFTPASSTGLFHIYCHAPLATRNRSHHLIYLAPRMSESPKDLTRTSSVSEEHARFENAAIYLARGPSASSKPSLSLEYSVSESSATLPVASTSFKRAHSLEREKANKSGESVVTPVRRPIKRTKTESSLSVNVHDESIRRCSR